MGAFAVANASPRMPWVSTIAVESPYPTFNAWYGERKEARMMSLFDRAFPRSSAAIQGVRNIARAEQKRILVAWSDADAVTPPALSRQVARAAPPERTTEVEIKGAPHLEFLATREYREALLRHFG